MKLTIALLSIGPETLLVGKASIYGVSEIILHQKI
jgi:hypothetical protein